MINNTLSIPTYTHTEVGIYILIIIGIIIASSFIIGGLIAFIVAIKKDEESIFSVLVFLFGLLTIAFPIFFLVTAIKDDIKYPEWYKSKIVEVKYEHIYSLSLYDHTDGKFTLGFGKLSTDSYYYFYVKDDENAYFLEKLKITKNVRLKEENITPRIEERKDANSNCIYTIIYVPVGTIISTDYQALY